MVIYETEEELAPPEEPAGPTTLQPEDLQHSEQSAESQQSEQPSQVVVVSVCTGSNRERSKEIDNLAMFSPL